MDTISASEIANSLRSPDNRAWHDCMHIATDCFRKGVIKKLNRDNEIDGSYPCSLVEIYLSEELPEIDAFEGIFEVDDIGIWYYDGDGHIDEAIWRQRVIPWKFIKGLVLHQTS